MELVSLGKDVLQDIVEHAASYSIGQSVLRQIDRALWVVEKCARWAVPPPLDQDERPQPELIRPLPWMFFMMMLIALRVTRESISLVNLVMGKPPLRSADVVIFIQSKRRYLRTLKYQGNRMMRARSTAAPPADSWYNSLCKLLELTMCFRRKSTPYANNNTTQVSNNDEVMVVKRSKRGRQEASPGVSINETTMERLIEKMLVDLDVESDEDSSYTLTNATSPKSEKSGESDPDVTLQNTPETPTKENGSPAQNDDDEIRFSPTNYVASSTPEKEDIHNNQIDSKKSLTEDTQFDINQTNSNEKPSPKKEVKRELEEYNLSGIPNCGKSQIDKFRENLNSDSPNSDYSRDAKLPMPAEILSTKQESENFIANETQKGQRTPKKEPKIANGRLVKSVPNKKKGPHREKQNSNEVPPARVLTSNNSA